MGLFSLLFGNETKYCTLDLVGYTHDCKFKSKKIRDRQSAIKSSKKGDAVTIREYSYKKSPAYAVIHDDGGYDIGVIAANDIYRAIKKLGPLDGLKGEIVMIDHVHYDNYDPDIDEPDSDNAEMHYICSVSIHN